MPWRKVGKFECRDCGITTDEGYVNPTSKKQTGHNCRSCSSKQFASYRAARKEKNVSTKKKVEDLVYFAVRIYPDATKFYKIGHSTTAAIRGGGFGVVVHTEPGGRARESALHALFAPYQETPSDLVGTQGATEWFQGAAVDEYLADPKGFAARRQSEAPGDDCLAWLNGARLPGALQEVLRPNPKFQNQRVRVATKGTTAGLPIYMPAEGGISSGSRVFENFDKARLTYEAWNLATQTAVQKAIVHQKMNRPEALAFIRAMGVSDQDRIKLMLDAAGLGK